MAKQTVQRYINNMKKRGDRIVVRRTPLVNKGVPNYLRSFLFAKSGRHFMGV